MSWTSPKASVGSSSLGSARQGVPVSAIAVIRACNAAETLRDLFQTRELVSTENRFLPCHVELLKLSIACRAFVVGASSQAGGRDIALAFLVAIQELDVHALVLGLDRRDLSPQVNRLSGTQRVRTSARDHLLTYRACMPVVLLAGVRSATRTSPTALDDLSALKLGARKQRRAC